MKINKELSFVQFELRGCRNQYDGKVYYGVVNNVADEQAKLGMKYSVPQIAFYKGIIEAIVQDGAGQGCISNIDALHIKLDNQVPSDSQSQSQPASQFPEVPAALKNFSMSQKEKTLEELIRDGWLSSTPDGNIGLGIRSFLDLRSWFRNNEIPSCEVCNEAGVKAESCPNEDCTVRIHKYCLIKRFSQRKAKKICPGCQNPWPYSVTKAEVVEHDEDELAGSTQNQPSNEPSQRKRRRSNKSQTQNSDDVKPGSSQEARLRRSVRLR